MFALIWNLSYVSHVPCNFDVYVHHTCSGMAPCWSLFRHFRYLSNVLALKCLFYLLAVSWSHTLYMWSATLHLDLLCLSVTLPTFYLGLFICPCTYVHPDTHTLTCILTFIRVHAHAHIYICALSPTLSHIFVLYIYGV